MQLERQVKKDTALKGIYQELVSSYKLVFKCVDLRGVIPAYERLYQAYELLEDYPQNVIAVANNLWLDNSKTPDDLLGIAEDYLFEYWD